MDTEDLIKKLSEEGIEKPMLSPLKQASMSILGTVVFMSALASYSGLRFDIGDKVHDLAFVLETVCLFVLGVLSTIASFYYARPDGPPNKFIRYAPVVMIPVWFGLAYHNSMYMLGLDNIMRAFNGDGIMCACHILFVTVVPLFVLFYFLKLGASVQHNWAGATSSLGITSFAYLFMRYVEPIDDLAHLMIWHALPILLVCALSVGISKLVFKW
jgi:hypothetical protein